jgi:glycosyltransferase involved in cell wall biosynthesis
VTVRLEPEAREARPGRVLGVAMVVYDDITFDSRVQREATSLALAGHSVTIFCQGYQPPATPMLDPRVRVEVVVDGMRSASLDTPSPIITKTGLRRFPARLGYLRAYYRNLRAWGRAVAGAQVAVDVWHAHDFTGLVAATMARRRGAALVYDMHDLFLDTGAGTRLPGPLRAALAWYERRLARRADLMVTVNVAMAAHIRKHLQPTSDVVTVHNCVPRWSVPEPRPTLIRDAGGIHPAEPVLLYHGALAADRGLETLYEAILQPGLGRAHLVLLGFGPDRARLVEVAGEPRFGGRIHVLDPVQPTDLPLWVSSADVGVIVMPQTTTNLYLSTPNKLFECLAAGVPVVASNFPVVRAIVLDEELGPLGTVCDPASTADIARAVRAIVELDDEHRDDLRRRCAAAAATRWNWEAEAQHLVDAYQRLAASRTT